MSPANAASPVEVLEPWIAGRLHPVAEARVDTRRIHSDQDLQGNAVPTHEGPLVSAAVLVALVERETGLNLILTRRADTLTRHSGQVALPGGRADPGETPWITALREAEEEIGLERRFVRLAGLGDLYRTFTGFEITPVVAFVSPGFTITPSAGEVAEVFETPFAFLMDPGNHEQRTWEGPAGTRRYYAMSHGDRLIWGATAGILRGLWARLFGEEVDVQGLGRESLSRQSPPLASAGR